MQVSFVFDSLDEAARVLEFLNSGGEWPSKDAGRPRREPSRPRRQEPDDDGPPFDGPYVGDDEGDGDDPEDDPWASSGPSRSKASSGRSGRSRGGSGGSGVRTKDVGAPSGFQRWEFGHEDAPDCECDEPAAKVSGWKGKDSPTGKASWVAWRCAKGAGRDWKNKCDFFEGTR